MLPTGAGKCKETLYLLQHPTSRLESDSDKVFQEKINNLMKFVTKVNDEDIEIVQKVSKGIRNKTYRGGRFSPDMEMTCYRFQNMLADGMIERNLIFPPKMTDYYEHVFNPSIAIKEEHQEVDDNFLEEAAIFTEIGDALHPTLDQDVHYSLVEVDQECGMKVVIEDIKPCHTLVEIDPTNDTIKMMDLGEAISNACENGLNGATEVTL